MMPVAHSKGAMEACDLEIIAKKFQVPKDSINTKTRKKTSSENTREKKDKVIILATHHPHSIIILP
jgi:hypothetical protein